MNSKMTKIAIFGHFGFGKELLNGQTVKTKNLVEALVDKFGQDQIMQFDTAGGLKALFKLPFQIKNSLKEAEDIIIVPAHRGIRVISPMLLHFNKKKKRRIHYVVVGGWLPSLCLKEPKLAAKIKAFDYIYVETSTMKKALDNQGFSNVVVMPNFKFLNPLSCSQLNYQCLEPFSVCTFSRVMKEKGIEDAIDAVKKINADNKKITYKLDIYGQVDSSQIAWFESLKRGFPSFVQYKGCIPSNQSVEVIRNYFAVLFPTKFYTEGIPGTIIDAYCAGVPVIASRWESFNDLIDDGKTGIGYDFSNKDNLVSVLAKIAREPNIINEMKTNCLERAKVTRQP